MSKILIIGGGIAGLTAGIFAQKSGFESIIFEKHSILGGECTGWDRNGYHIDGCIHWLTGTKEGDEINNLWKQVGALGNVGIYKPDRFLTIEFEGRQIIIYRDMNQLRNHLLEISPEDQQEIDKLIFYIKALENVKLPCAKPVDMMNLIDFYNLSRSMKGKGKIIKELSRISVGEYSKRFHSPLIQKAICSIIPPEYTAAGLIFTLGTFMYGNGDIPIGGSRAMTDRMTDSYKKSGGKVKTNAEVEEIIIEKGMAKGIITKDGHVEYGNYIVPACDTFVTYYKLLKGKYIDPKFAERYSEPQKYPLYSCLYISLAVNADLSELPERFAFQTSPFTCGDKTYHELAIHHYCYDSFAPEGKSIMISSISTDTSDYRMWKKLKEENPAKYGEEKDKIAGKVIEGIEDRFPEMKGKISVLDISTPITYERYCNAYQGAWMSFAMLPNTKQMIHSGKIKGISNLFMAGQWLMPPGGLPIALITGKWAVQRICHKEKRGFSDGN